MIITSRTKFAHVNEQNLTFIESIVEDSNVTSYHKYAKYVTQLRQQSSVRTSSAFSAWTDYSLESLLVKSVNAKKDKLAIIWSLHYIVMQYVPQQSSSCSSHAHDKTHESWQKSLTPLCWHNGFTYYAPNYAGIISIGQLIGYSYQSCFITWCMACTDEF